MGDARTAAKSSSVQAAEPQARARVPRANGEIGLQSSSPAAAPAGNLQTMRALGIRPKLAVSQPDDPEEREADRAADAFVARKPVAQGCPSCDAGDQQVMRKIDGRASARTEGSGFEHGAGDPLDTTVRREYESF